MYMLLETKEPLFALKISVSSDEPKPETAIPFFLLSNERYCALRSCRRTKPGGVD